MLRIESLDFARMVLSAFLSSSRGAANFTLSSIVKSCDADSDTAMPELALRTASSE